MDGTETLLLVDDEDLIRQLARDILKGKGYTVFEASHGKEALDIFTEKKDTIDLIIMDLMMPIMDGKKTFKKMKQIKSDVKVIFATGFTEEGESEEMIAGGAIAVIEKPYRVEKLADIIRSILAPA